MGRAAWVVGGLLGVLGFVLGYAVGSVGGTDDPGPSQFVPPDANAVGTAREPAERSARTPVPAAPAPLEPPPLGPADEEMTGKALEEPLTSSPAPAVGMIRGSVRTPEGQGVGDVEIVAWALEPEGLREIAWGSWQRGGPERPIEERVQAYVRIERWRETTRRSARTQPDGSFALTELADTSYHLEARSKRWQVHPTNLEYGRGARPGTVVEFRAAPKFTIPMRVVGPDGKDVESAQIRFHTGPGSYSGTEWRRSRGVVEMTIQPGTFQVVAVAGDNEELKSDPFEVELRQDADVPPVVLHLRGRPGVSGRLVFGPAWGRIDNCHIKILRFRGAEPPTDAELAEEGQERWVHGNRGLRFTFGDLAPGRYRLGATSRYGGSIDAAWTVDVADRMVVRDFEAPDPVRARYVEVRAFDPDGRPLPNVSYSLSVRSQRNSSSNSASYFRRADGVDWIRWDDFSGDREADAKWYVVARHEQYGSTEVEFTPGPEATATVRFETPAFVAAAVADYTGSALEGTLAFSLQPAGALREMNLSYGQPPIDAEGRVRFGPFVPGEYDLLLTGKSGRSSIGTLARLRVTLGPGDNSYTLAVPPLHSLTVELGAAKKGKGVRISRQKAGEGLGGRHDDRTADENGRAVFDRLLAGEYEFRMEGEREGRTVTVPGTEVLRW